MTAKRPATKRARQPKAYSYIRFSTPEQAEGDSLRRQTEAARTYCERNGLELDLSLNLRDAGVSAFRGGNIAEDKALGGFLKAVEDGLVKKGSYLLVENLDRISRDNVRRAVRTLENLVDAGINVVDISDGGRVYNTDAFEKDPYVFLVMTIKFMRANEESARKSDLLLSAWSRNRHELKNPKAGRPFTRMLPGWLTWNESKRKFAVIAKRAALLRTIFAKADAGWSKHKIARWLNQKKTDTWGKGKRKAPYWHSSYIQKLLTNRAAVGLFTPHRVTKAPTGKRERKPLDPVEGYFPVVIDRDLFERVSAQAKATAPRGRNAKAKPKSIFAGIIKCGRCAGSVIRVSKGEHVYLVCSRAHAKAQGCRYLAVPYHEVEHAVVSQAGVIINEVPRGVESAKSDAAIRKQDDRVSDLEDAAEQLASLAAEERSDAARRLLREREAELEAARERLRELRLKRDATASEHVTRRLETVKEALERKPLKVSEANKALRQAVSRMVLNPEQGQLAIYWHHTETPTELPVYSPHRKGFEASPFVDAGKPVADGYVYKAKPKVNQRKRRQA